MAMSDKELYTELRRRVMEKSDICCANGGEDERLFGLIDEAICEYARSSHLTLSQRIKARKQVFASIRGFGVIQELLEDPDITEIMVNGPGRIFFEKDGRISRFEGEFEDERQLSDLVQKIAAGANRVINEASPIVDARLPADGSRVNLVLPPVALNGPIVTIRKFPKEIMTLERLIELGSVDEETAEFLRRAIRAKLNIVISGGTGTGKTTFLNALSGCIPSDERVITIEDSAELQLNGIENLVTLEARNSNVEGRNGVSIRDLIKTALRMRPDRIVVGEVRDGACIDMLQALNTGHSGMSTGHANSTADMLSRMETMCLLGADIPISAVRRQIASAIDLMIHLGRFRDKTRKVVEITEVAGYEHDEIVLNTLYKFEELGEKEGHLEGKLIPTGNPVIRTDKFRAAGL